MADFNEIMTTIGRATATAGSFIGRKVSEGYKFVDPDLRRHIFQSPLLIHTLFVPRTEKMAAREPDGYPPLIFVHGMGGNRGNFYLMSKYLAYHGRKRSYMIHFPGGLSIEEMASHLAAFVGKVTEVTGEPKVDIIAHSLGGLVVRLAMAESADMGNSVCNFITLGTPHKGTFPARFATAQKLMDLRPGSDLITRLEKAGLPDKIRCVSFWSKSDLLVLPPESAMLDGSEQIEAEGFTHYSYLLSPSSWINVARALEGQTCNNKQSIV